MTPTETTAILRQFNNWCRDPSDFPASPMLIEKAIDAAIAMIDRLEGAESDALEQARLNGMGASREAALLAKLEAAEKERDELRAKVAGLVPIGLLHVGGYYGEELEDWEFEADQQACDRLNEAHFQREATLNLYALPGAKGE